MLLTILEILVFMVAAAILGVLLGWVLRGAFSSEQVELSDLRAQLRKLKRQQREKEADSKAEKVSTPVVTSTPVAGKKEQTKVPAANKKTVAKKRAATKTRNTAAVKTTRKKVTSRRTTTERTAEQKAAKKAVVDIVSRIGKGESKDDLTQIYGIGPKFAAMLNRMGIKSHAQIAKLRKAEVKTISSALGVFSDRIERDDWVSGAKKVIRAQK